MRRWVECAPPAPDTEEQRQERARKLAEIEATEAEAARRERKRLEEEKRIARLAKRSEQRFIERGRGWTARMAAEQARRELLSRVPKELRQNVFKRGFEPMEES